jgi:predicted RNase H-like nuclease (RuvC/YqgF family)
MLVLLGQQIEAPPMEGVNGWAIGFAVSCIVATASAVWSEYQRRTERKDKKEEQKTVATISAEQERTRLEFESVKNIIEELKSYNKDLREQCTALILSVSERDKTIASFTSRIIEMEREIANLKMEVKSLEFSRDQAQRKLDSRAEETNPK